uniref:Uncharacterized protein n=1 Tax=Timema poppense TaxID=170557 RepID=A0A7R9CQR2_TIMPO|nr:unnamed protein product [Timema poppensis]
MADAFVVHVPLRPNLTGLDWELENYLEINRDVLDHTVNSSLFAVAHILIVESSQKLSHVKKVPYGGCGARFMVSQPYRKQNDDKRSNDIKHTPLETRIIIRKCMLRLRMPRTRGFLPVGCSSTSNPGRMSLRGDNQATLGWFTRLVAVEVVCVEVNGGRAPSTQHSLSGWKLAGCVESDQATFMRSLLCNLGIGLKGISTQGKLPDLRWINAPISIVQPWFANRMFTFLQDRDKQSTVTRNSSHFGGHKIQCTTLVLATDCQRRRNPGSIPVGRTEACSLRRGGGAPERTRRQLLRGYLEVLYIFSYQVTATCGENILQLVSMFSKAAVLNVCSAEHLLLHEASPSGPQRYWIEKLNKISVISSQNCEFCVTSVSFARPRLLETMQNIENANEAYKLYMAKPDKENQWCQLNLSERRKFWELKEEAEDRAHWQSKYIGKRDGPIFCKYLKKVSCFVGVGVVEQDGNCYLDWSQI